MSKIVVDCAYYRMRVETGPGLLELSVNGKQDFVAFVTSCEPESERANRLQIITQETKFPVSENY